MAEEQPLGKHLGGANQEPFEEENLDKNSDETYAQPGDEDSVSESDSSCGEEPQEGDKSLSNGNPFSGIISKMAGKKSLPVAYTLWFFLGWTGIHLFYLRRDKHAFFTWATLGGVIGMSWIRDVFCIPRYVADVNETEEYMRELGERMRNDKKPKQGVCRWAASLCLGYLFAILIYMSLWSEDLHERYQIALSVLAHFSAAVGVWIPCNEGRQKVSFMWCFIGAYITLPLTVMYGFDSLWYGPLVSSGVAGYMVEWRRQPNSDGLCKRISVLTLLGVIYLGLFSTAIYYNATVTSKGETVPLRVAIQNFFNSKAWRDTKETFHQIYNYYKHHGIGAIWEEILAAFDPSGENHAYEVLGLKTSATQKEIKSAYKSLAIKYHPDKEKDPAKKKEQADKFMEIQNAYNILSNLQKGRGKKNEL